MQQNGSTSSPAFFQWKQYLPYLKRSEVAEEPADSRQLLTPGSREVVADMETKLRPRRSGARIAAGEGDFAPLQFVPDRLWGPPCLLFNRYGGKAAGAWCWPLPSNAEVKDEWWYIFTAYYTRDETQFAISSKTKHEDSSLFWCYSGHRVEFLKNLNALNVRVKQSRSWIAWPRPWRHYYRLCP